MAVSEKLWKEFDKVRDAVNNVYVILQDGEKVGLITNRYTYTQWYVAHVGFIMYGKNDSEETIDNIEVLGGCGYDKFGEGITSILRSLKDPLKKYFGIDFDEFERDIYYSWKDAFEKAGYKILQVI